MRILKLFVVFWVPTAIVLLLSIFSTEQAAVTDNNIIPTITILQRNLMVMFIIWASGFLNKYIPYWIFGFNSVFFSVILALNGNIINLTEIMKYGVIEILSFSIALSIAGKMKISYLISATILMIVAAFLENLVMRGVL